MKTKLERIFNLLIFVPAPPIAGFLAGWCIAYFFMSEKWFPYLALGGLALGLIFDIPVVQRIVKNSNPLPLMYGAAVICFYAVVLFGAFMGVPVFHVILSLPAAFLVGSKLAHSNSSEKDVRSTALKTAILMTVLIDLVFVASSFIALISPSTPGDLKGMLGLNFEVTQSMVLSIIFVGGFFLMIVNFFLTRELIYYFHRVLITE